MCAPTRPAPALAPPDQPALQAQALRGWIDATAPGTTRRDKEQRRNALHFFEASSNQRDLETIMGTAFQSGLWDFSALRGARPPEKCGERPTDAPNNNRSQSQG